MGYNSENLLIIETPEGIDFSLRLAGPVIRCLSCVLDIMCISVITKALSLITNLLILISTDLGLALEIVFYFLVSIGYGIILEYFWRGQTIGKRLFKLQVMDIQGLNLQLHQVIIRNLFRVVDVLPLLYAVGGISCLFSKYSQRLGDIAANTIVVWNPVITEPDLEQLLADKYNSFRDYPHLVGRLRQKVSPKEAGVALHALLRRNQFDLTDRIELFREIAQWFKDITEFPQEAVDSISDEQYIRNVVDVIFRTETYKT
jgi:uncharacterized RDD family membrane protein YckC